MLFNFYPSEERSIRRIMKIEWALVRGLRVLPVPGPKPAGSIPDGLRWELLVHVKLRNDPHDAPVKSFLTNLRTYVWTIAGFEITPGGDGQLTTADLHLVEVEVMLRQIDDKL